MFLSYSRLVAAMLTLLQARGDDLPSDSAARPLIEKMFANAENLVYVESVLKGALASMYIGMLEQISDLTPCSSLCGQVERTRPVPL